MSEAKKNDDLADALAALAAGEHHEEPPVGSGMAGREVDLGSTPAPGAATPVVPPSKPVRSGAPVPRAAGGMPPQPVARSGAPVPPGHGAGAPMPASGRTPPRPAGVTPVSKQRASAPVPGAGGAAARPGAPGVPQAPKAGAPKVNAPLRPASPNSKVRPQAPGAPGARSSSPPREVAPPPAAEPFVQPEEPSAEELAARHEAEVAMEADAVAHVVEGNDTLNMPTPSQESLGAPWKTPARPKHEPMLRTLAFKQTMIPILLTMGVLLSGIAVWVFSLGEESPVAGATWIPAAALGIGAVMLVFAVVTMLQVRGQMTASAGT